MVVREVILRAGDVTPGSSSEDLLDSIDVPRVGRPAVPVRPVRVVVLQPMASTTERLKQMIEELRSGQDSSPDQLVDVSRRPALAHLARPVLGEERQPKATADLVVLDPLVAPLLDPRSLHRQTSLSHLPYDCITRATSTSIVRISIL